MNPIQDVENMQPEAIELLEAAGYVDAHTIFDHRIPEITTELVKANNVLDIVDTEPNQEIVMKWLKPLETKFGKSLNKDGPSIDPNMLIKPKAILDTPFALSVPEKFIEEHGIDLSELPSGNIRFIEKEQAIAFLNNTKTAPVSYDLLSDQTINDLIEEAEDTKTELLDHSSSLNKNTAILDKSRILKTETFQNKGSHVTPIARDENVHHTKVTNKKTNEGVDPTSKFYVKGVLHRNAPRFKSGCRSLIIANLLVPLSFAITSLILIDKDKYAWAVWAPLLIILAVVLCYIATQRSSCPICNQKQFAAKRCLKHKNAHRWPLFGYMLPTAIHALLYKWFRCIFCGTSIRLKK